MKIPFLSVFLCCVAGELYDQLHYFETLKHVDLNVKVRRKRSLDGGNTATKDVTFSAFGKDFNLVLTPGTPVISNDFKAKLVYKDGRTAPLSINQNDFFTGHLSDDKNVKADASLEDGLWTANIYAKEDIYSLEPSWRHLPTSDNHSMIVYRHSDIKWNNIFPDLASQPNKRKKVCGSIHPEDERGFNKELAREEELKAELNDLKKTNASRTKRAVPATNTCQIIAVADFRFLSGPGGGFPHRAANYIIQTMQKVDRIYRKTTWNNDLGYYGMGLQIKELRIHPEFTQRGNYHDNGRHYNMNDSNISWADEDLLRQFGEDKDHPSFCLAHLFTHRSFAGGVLGLAYIASPRKYSVGGICSYYRRSDRAYNTGFSSTMNTKGSNLLTQEAVLVTAHEFGHNWGSEHDAETSECAPSGFDDGKYIMYPYAVSGYDENNDDFSPCSKRYISAVLATRSSTCFKGVTANVPLCGNGIIDKGEDCDGGGLGLSGFDPCCSEKCTFVGDAKCSPVNFECCKDCRMAPKNHPCRAESKETCQKAGLCTGTSLDCPTPEPLKDNTPCIDEGKCIAGECMDYCSYEGKISNKALSPCRCEDDVTACLRCCRSRDGHCKPYNVSNYLPDGRPCSYGYCEDGKCQKTDANMIQRLFSFIEHLDSSTLVAFMKSNIVGTIIVFSLPIWIAASWVITCIDRRNERKAREQDLRWVSNEALLNQSLQSTVLANQLQDYKVRESNLHRIDRPPPPKYYYGPSGQQKGPEHRKERKYKFYNEPDSPVEMESSV